MGWHQGPTGFVVVVMVPVLFFINRDQDEARRAFVQGNAAAAGYQIERVPAIDGYAPDFAAQHAERIGGKVGPGTQACFLSHARAWARIAEGTAPVGLVCEDDARFLRPAAELEPYLAAMAGHDMLWLNDRSVAYRAYGSIAATDLLTPLATVWAATSAWPRDPTFPYFSRNLRDLRAPGGDFYALTQAGARHLLAEFARDGARTDVDCWMFFKAIPAEAARLYWRRFIPRWLALARIAPAEQPLAAAIVDRPFGTTDTRLAGGRVRNPPAPA